MSFNGLGKIILLGEHAVVYGYPALAAALDRGVSVGAVPTPAGGTLRVDIPSWNLKLTVDDDHPLARALAAIADALELGRPPVTLVGEAQIPPGAGLGASAAFAVAIARALIDYRDSRIAASGGADDARDARRGHRRRERERGADPRQGRAASTSRSPRRRHRRVPQGERPAADPEPACACSSDRRGAPRSTAQMVERSRTHARARADDPRLHELGALDRSPARPRCSQATHVALGAAMDRAHALLGELGVSTPLLDGLCDAARRVGAYGAKLTGAGGGGAVIAIAPRDKESDVLAAWRAGEVEGFVAKVGS